MLALKSSTRPLFVQRPVIRSAISTAKVRVPVDVYIQFVRSLFDNAHTGLKRNPEDSSEQLVIVGERAAGAHKLDMGPITDAIRAAIAVRHGVTVRDVVLTSAGAIPAAPHR